MVPESACASRTEAWTTVSSTVSSSSEELTAWLISPRACSSSTERVSSCVRTCSCWNRCALSIAITAWSASALRSIVASPKGPACARCTANTPRRVSSRNSGTASSERQPTVRDASPRPYSASRSTSGISTTLRVTTHRPAADRRSSCKRGAAPFRPPFLVKTIERRRAKLDVLQPVDDTPVGAAEPDRAFDQPFQDHIERARGAPDDQLERFAQSGLPRQCVDERARPSSVPVAGSPPCSPPGAVRPARIV